MHFLLEMGIFLSGSRRHFIVEEGPMTRLRVQKNSLGIYSTGAEQIKNFFSEQQATHDQIIESKEDGYRQ